MKKGFTLIELLVVVLIIGILASIALPQYTKAVEKSRAAEAFIMLKNITDAANRLYLQNGSYTLTNYGDLDLDFPGAVGGNLPTKYYIYQINQAGGGIFRVTAFRSNNGKFPTLSEDGGLAKTQRINIVYRLTDGGIPVKTCTDENSKKNCKSLGATCPASGDCTFD
ncbi:prepilin-type N-terminal cleavage/methylation domain-containing protein [Elusimicrobium posterum]|uniref:type IV pilin protein n=1 Tax=Elusimicrobium posterum TaxID=3116653 RepID=UPI003C78B1D7